MTIQEVKDYFKIDSVHQFTEQNVAEALVGNYDGIIVVNKFPDCHKIAFLAMMHENSVFSIYVDENNCYRETLDKFCEEYGIKR